jgi:hypothetical protein
MIYRPGLLPDAGATITRWRDHFCRRGLGDPYVVMPQANGAADPRDYGIDAAAGFPPHPFGWDLPKENEGLTLFDNRFHGRAMSYDALVDSALAQHSEEFTVFPGVCPSWDNEARRPGRSTCFIGSSPKKYGAWLEHACRLALQARSADERIVFVNAWNEWAEGAYLEPDRHYGYAYLRETARTLGRLALPHGKKRATNGAAIATAGGRAAGSTGTISGLIRAARRRGANAVETLADAIRPDR